MNTASRSLSRRPSEYKPISPLVTGAVIHRKSIDRNPTVGSSEGADWNREERFLARASQASRHGGAEGSGVPLPIGREAGRSFAQALNTASPASAESRFGHDFSRIAVHGHVPASGSSPIDGLTRIGDGANDANPTPPTGPASAPAPAPAAPAAPATPCAQPVNWRHSGAVDHGPDAIRINIAWDSSTGSLADLSQCEVREVVSYDPIPNPPFLWNPPNPTILTVPGSSGVAMDTHSYPPGLKNGITSPRQQGTMTAHQVYQFRCTGPGCAGTWTDFPGQTYDITREVFPEYVRINPWRYRITKQGTGAGNTFNYSRDVEVPPP
jgi:hypothetical protein